MAANEAKVKVKLDTGPAEAALRGLGKRAASTARRAGAGIAGEVRKGVGAIGMGAGIGAGLAAVRGATSSGIGDVIGEAFGGIGASLAHSVLGGLGESARADKSAREETIQAFGAIAGQNNKVPPSAHNFFNQVKSLREDEEKGRTLFETDSRFRSTGPGDLVERIMKGVGDMVATAVKDLGDLLNPFK